MLLGFIFTIEIKIIFLAHLDYIAVLVQFNTDQRLLLAVLCGAK